MPVYDSRVLALVLAVTFAGAAAATPAGKEGPRKETAAEALRKALDQGITLELTDTPMHAAIQQLGEMAKVTIIWDRNAVFGSPDEMLISLKARDTRLRTALRTVTSQHGLTFGIVGDHILVGTEEVVNYRQLRQRVRLDLDGEAFSKVLKDLAQQTGTNIVLDPRAQKGAEGLKVELHLDDVPLETAVRLMAEMGDMKPVRLGNVLYVTTEARAEKLKAEAETAPPGLREAADKGPQALPAPMILPAGPPAMPVAPPPAMRDARMTGPFGMRFGPMLRQKLQSLLTGFNQPQRHKDTKDAFFVSLCLGGC